MTVHLISVGLSLLNVLADPYDKLGSHPEIYAAVRNAEPKPHQLLRAAGIKNTDDDRSPASDWINRAVNSLDSPEADQVRSLAAGTRPQDWPPPVSAELDTFARLPKRTAFRLGRDDIALLICSDTPNGLLAGLWNALAIADGDLENIRYQPDPETPLGDVRGRVVMVRVTGMDAGDEGFRKAMRGLGFLARNLFSSGSLTRGEEFRFVLSGGYKAAIPYLIGLAEAVRSVDDECLRQIGVSDLAPVPVPYPVQAYVQHETADSQAKPVALPLRRLIAESVREEVSGFDKSGRRKDVPGSRLFEGYVFDKERGWPRKVSCRLTPFGEGLRALFGTAREEPGGG